MKLRIFLLLATVLVSGAADLYGREDMPTMSAADPTVSGAPQNITVTGTVTDQDGKPTHKVTLTDE